MSAIRWVGWIILALCGSLALAAKNASKEDDVILSQDYIDDIKEYSSHHAQHAKDKYTERLNKIDLLDDEYPKDEDFEVDHSDDDDDYDEEDDYEDYEDEDYYDDDDDDDVGGCGGGDDDDDDDDDYDDEELSPVEAVIEEFFTR
ncbi:hypothetical protein Pmani_006120 [Petrolisthes manimaculis]|uniref:Uncharacterized protein n=1 Tax=Petrolisthes manimaculis TaxID=1843537 RepID=A0AAE1QDN1_9EUCA|nr:hypothetical protein Pmani_006120 [Petrolisthes manimaculis]